MKHTRRILLFALVCIGMAAAFRVNVYANALIPSVDLSIGGTNDPTEVVPAIQVLFFISIIALAPSLLVLLTGFTRIVISLHFLRAAMGTQQMPPNQVLLGVAIFLTLFLMAPVFTEINENALQPFGNGELSAEQAIERGMEPISQFMRRQTAIKDVSLFLEMADEVGVYETIDDIPDRIIIPAFVLGEMTKGFIIGFVMYLPFIVIDMVVASVLMAMGMMMLPPAMISMPFKIMLFLLAGGWEYVIGNVMLTFK